MATPLLKVMGVDNVLHNYVEQLHVLDLPVHQVNFLGWMGDGEGDHSETLLVVVAYVILQGHSQTF